VEIIDQELRLSEVYHFCMIICR